MAFCTVVTLDYQADPSERFVRFRTAPGAVLLDSGRPVANRGRYDIASAWPLKIFHASDAQGGDAFFGELREALAAMGKSDSPEGLELPFCGGLIGYLSYDFGRRLEQLPTHAENDLGLPDARIGLYDWALVTDHVERRTVVVFHPSAPSSRREAVLTVLRNSHHPTEAFRLQSAFRADIDAATYRSAIERIHTYITAGDCYQVNYAQRFTGCYEGDPWHAYRRLRAVCPTPFSAYVSLESNQAILSHSPERFLSLNGRHVETRPIKGTRPRGTNPDDDRLNSEDLLTSPKDRAENLMIVDLLRNDLGRSCTAGSVNVPQLFALETYPNVHHLVSSVEGELAAGRDVFDLLAGSFPGGSITGAPKIRAMEIIDELEPTRRGPYCGSVLYIDVNGRMDSSITIRTLLAWSGQIHCWGGGGIVADSDWQAEYEESITKVRLLLDTLNAP
ncbi:aminodeoxychorismate synthase component I [Pseudomonas sp. Marseille-QA0892]